MIMPGSELGLASAEGYLTDFTPLITKPSINSGAYGFCTLSHIAQISLGKSGEPLLGMPDYFFERIGKLFGRHRPPKMITLCLLAA